MLSDLVSATLWLLFLFWNGSQKLATDPEEMKSCRARDDQPERPEIDQPDSFPDSRAQKVLENHFIRPFHVQEGLPHSSQFNLSSSVIRDKLLSISADDQLDLSLVVALAPFPGYQLETIVA
ncbi:hypothetical protein B0T24DRAFT_595920 [Lasiosphaeria ovina]|uniref:Uncharacterized protein n=1 Tax=Lasiosphaeria ovina TaxID=92902 RepID=A0AAE0N4H1_9PEZI|nr:hypothetical protein B0T24DRAFT_595920 [Lasiosphaeria ovina]